VRSEGRPGTTADGQGTAGGRLAVFDLDGTITRQDTLVPYVLGFLRGKPWRLAGVVRILPVLVDFTVGRADHGDVKARFIRATLGGTSRTELMRWTAQFVSHVVSRGVFKDALERIAGHQRAGDRLILMSASCDLYVPALGEALGFADIVCTQLRWDGDRLNGALASPNRRGTEKTWVLRELRQRFPGRQTVAYGNARSDLDHLKLADQGFLVNGGRRARRDARRAGIACVRWR
jgi:HAD superfamily hydrolase (TIGR01490 family)